MTLRNFIKENKDAIDSAIKKSGGKYFNYEERRLWVLNDESLYVLARRSGVKI